MRKVILTVFIGMSLLNLDAQNIQRTVCQGNLERLDSLLLTESIEVKDNRGRSLLHWAVACKQEEVFHFLIDKGIDINSEDYQEKTAMHVAAQYSNKTFFDLLVDLQSDPNWKKKYGGSLMEQSAMKKDTGFIEILVSTGIDINCTNERGSSALEISKRIESKSLEKFLLRLGADQNAVRSITWKKDYMERAAPGSEPEIFAPNFISTEGEEFGSVFNDEETEFYFAVVVNGKNEIRFSKLVDDHWTKPTVIISDEKYSYNDPFLSPDQNRLYYISDRALDGAGDKKDIDIWYSTRKADGWSSPINAGENINSERNEYYISFTSDGTMYFSSNANASEDNIDNYDIYSSTFVNGSFEEPKVLSETVNTSGYEADVFVALDESYIIFCSTRSGGFGQGDLYIAFKNSDDEWSEAKNLGNSINSVHYEYCPFVTSDGKYLFFTSNQDIYWVNTAFIDALRE